MRHLKAGKKLGRTSSHRKAMFRNMVTSLFKYDQIVTTDMKAKQIRPLVEKMITLAKRGDLHARRQAIDYINDKGTVHKLFSEIKDRYINRQGGYVRIVKKGVRRGDAAPISVIQLLAGPTDTKKKKTKEKTISTATDKNIKSIKSETIQKGKETERETKVNEKLEESGKNTFSTESEKAE